MSNLFNLVIILQVISSLRWVTTGFLRNTCQRKFSLLIACVVDMYMKYYYFRVVLLIKPAISNEILRIENIAISNDDDSSQSRANDRSWCSI